MIALIILWAAVISVFILWILCGALLHDWIRAHADEPLWRHDQARALRALRARYENPAVVERNAIQGVKEWLTRMDAQLMEIRELPTREPQA